MNDLSKMTLGELRELKSNKEKEIRQINDEIAAKIESEKMAARSQIHKIAADLGMSIGDLIGGSLKVKRPTRSVPAKYRNPNDHAETWTGRGRKPKWVKAELEAGNALENFEIKN